MQNRGGVINSPFWTFLVQGFWQGCTKKIRPPRASWIAERAYAIIHKRNSASPTQRAGKPCEKCRNFSSKFVDFFRIVRIISFCMDTKKECKIPQCGSLADLAGKKVIVGAKQLRKALQNGRANCVFLAENADPALTDPLVDLCGKRHTPYF